MPDEAEVFNEVPRVILVTPHYGQVSMGLIRTLTMAVRDHSIISVVTRVESSSSVLPHCFNQLLAVALNQRDEGRVTHLAMAHSDILAEPGWLDTLWSEMWLRQADLISAVIPIKGPTGRTSTAIGSEDDPWEVRRCINIKDRRTLPETFATEEVCQPGEVLLVNTGLFLADLRRPWWDDFAFQFHTRLRKTAAGWVADCRSEDWELSHHLHQHKARYLATFKVRLRHDGHKLYPNYEDAA